MTLSATEIRLRRRSRVRCASFLAGGAFDILAGMQLSRRFLLGLIGAGAAPVLGVGSAAAAVPDDPVFDHIRAWITTKDEQDKLGRRWSRAEVKFFDRFRAEGLTHEVAEKKRWPEVRQMKALMREIKRLDRVLDRHARAIVRTPATTPRGALAKIEIALRIQDRIDFDTHAWELMSAGRYELKRLI